MRPHISSQTRARPVGEARHSSQSGFSLVEVVIATGVLATAIMSLGQLFGLSTRTNLGVRHASYSAILARQKVEELRALTWQFDTEGMPISDTSTDTTASREAATGGTGLRPSPVDALRRTTEGYVDYIDRAGAKLGGGTTPPDNTAYVRRWSVVPLPADPVNTLVIQVLASPYRNRDAADKAAVTRLPGEARLITVKTRKAQ